MVKKDVHANYCRGHSPAGSPTNTNSLAREDFQTDVLESFDGVAALS